MFFRQSNHKPIAGIVKPIEEILKKLNETDKQAFVENLNIIYAHQRVICHDYIALNKRIQASSSLLQKVYDFLENTCLNATCLRPQEIKNIKFFLNEVIGCFQNPAQLSQKGMTYIKNYFDDVTFCMNKLIALINNPDPHNEEIGKFLLDPSNYLLEALEALHDARALAIENNSIKTPYQKAFAAVQSVLVNLEEGFDLLSDNEKLEFVKEDLAECDVVGKINLKFSCVISWGLVVQPLVVVVNKNKQPTAEIFEENMLNSHLQQFKTPTGRWLESATLPSQVAIEKCGFSTTVNQSHTKYLLDIHEKIKNSLGRQLVAEVEHSQFRMTHQKFF